MNSAVALTVCRASAVTILPFRLTWLRTPVAIGTSLVLAPTSAWAATTASCVVGPASTASRCRWLPPASVFDGARAGLAPARRYRSASTADGTSFTQPAIAVYPIHPRQDRRRGQCQHDRDRMIPALPRSPIRHRGEQFQQVTASTGGCGRKCSRLTISNGNGRLDHGEAPGRLRICGKTHVFPELRPISAARRQRAESSAGTAIRDMSRLLAGRGRRRST
jgi:hypothetical protein